MRDTRPVLAGPPDPRQLQAPASVGPALGLLDSTLGAWWTFGLALLSVLFAVLEHGWQKLSRARLVQGGEGPASRERLMRMMAEGERAETALIVLRVAVQMALVVALVLFAQARVPGWWPGLAPDGPVLLAGLAAFLWITLFCRVLPAELPTAVHEALVRATMPSVILLGRLLSPPIEAFRRVLRIATGATPQAEAQRTADEILASVEEGEAEGHLGEHQADMIEQILSLRDLEVRRLMTPRTDVDVIDQGASIGQAREVALATGRSRYPVVDGDVDHVVGVVHVKDLLRLPREMPLKEVMREAWFVPESKFATELLGEFRRHRTHLAIVLDEYGGTAGVITIEDVLEEIVGEIDDEFDGDERPLELKTLDARRAVAPGLMRIDEINDAMSISLPENDDYETIGGFVFATLGRLPQDGEQLRHENLVLTVRGVVDRRVENVEIEILAPVG